MLSDNENYDIVETETDAFEELDYLKDYIQTLYNAVIVPYLEKDGDLLTKMEPRDFYKFWNFFIENSPYAQDLLKRANVSTKIERSYSTLSSLGGYY